MLNNNAILNLSALTLLALQIICFLWIDTLLLSISGTHCSHLGLLDRGMKAVYYFFL